MYLTRPMSPLPRWPERRCRLGPGASIGAKRGTGRGWPLFSAPWPEAAETSRVRPRARSLSFDAATLRRSSSAVNPPCTANLRRSGSHPAPVSDVPGESRRQYQSRAIASQALLSPPLPQAIPEWWGRQTLVSGERTLRPPLAPPEAQGLPRKPSRAFRSSQRRSRSCGVPADGGAELGFVTKAPPSHARRTRKGGSQVRSASSVSPP